METLANLDCFIRSAEAGGFSAAARRLGLTPAAVSRNVAVLERNLGVRLFHRSTRQLTLTEAGERFLEAIKHNVDGLQAAIAGIATDGDVPQGALRVSMSLTFGLNYVLPLLPAFLERYPRVNPDWQFENRQVDLVAEGFDAAIGAGFELSSGIVSRPLAPAHMIAVASPAFLKGRALPQTPADLQALDGIVMRSVLTGRVRTRIMRNAANAEMAAPLAETLIVNDPLALTQAALLGLGVTVIAVPDALPHLESGALLRLLPDWYSDAGPISIYFANKTLLPAKTRAFIDFVAETFRQQHLAQRFSASLTPHGDQGGGGKGSGGSQP